MKKILFSIFLFLFLLQGIVSASLGVINPGEVFDYYKADHSVVDYQNTYTFAIRNNYAYPVNVTVTFNYDEFEGGIDIDFVDGLIYEIQPSANQVVNIPFTVFANANLSGSKRARFVAAGYSIYFDVVFFEFDEASQVSYIFSGEGVSLKKFHGDPAGDLILPELINALPVLKVEDDSFKDYNIQGELVLPNNLTVIGSYAFGGNNFSNDVLIIPESVTNIGNFAFSPAQFKSVVFFNPDVSFSIPTESGGNRPFHSNLMNFSAYRYKRDGVTDSAPYATYLTSPSWHTNVEFYEIEGCTDPEANNADANAYIDDGSCNYNIIYGCTDPEADNYNPDATSDDGSCSYPVTGGGGGSFDEGSRESDVVEVVDDVDEREFSLDLELSNAQKFVAFAALVGVAYLLINNDVFNRKRFKAKRGRRRYRK